MRKEARTELRGISQPGRTRARNLENGRPSSLAKANICLDALATWLITPHIVKMIKMTIKTDVPASDFVALKNTCTNGMISGFARMSSMLPRQKQNVTSMAKPRVPLSTAVHIIARGSTQEASLISSAMCVAESGPMNVNTGPNIPTRHESPILPQFPPSVNCVNTISALLRGDSAQSGIRMAKKPVICRTRMIFSTIGSCLAR